MGARSSCPSLPFPKWQYSMICKSQAKLLHVCKINCTIQHKMHSLKSYSHQGTGIYNNASAFSRFKRAWKSKVIWGGGLIVISRHEVSEVTKPMKHKVGRQQENKKWQFLFSWGKLVSILFHPECLGSWCPCQESRGMLLIHWALLDQSLIDTSATSHFTFFL